MTQSSTPQGAVCKHCQKEIKPCWLGHISEFCEGWLHMSNYHDCEDGLHKAEPASTGGPNPQVDKWINSAAMEIRSWVWRTTGKWVSPSAIEELIQVSYLCEAARPPEPSAPACDWPFEGCCTHKELCLKANRCLKNLPASAVPQASPKEVAEQSAEQRVAGKDCLCLVNGKDGTAEHSGTNYFFRYLHPKKGGTFVACENHVGNYRTLGWCVEIPAAPQPVAGEGPQRVRCTNCGMYGFFVKHDASLGGLVLKCVDCGEQKLIEDQAEGTPKLEESINLTIIPAARNLLNALEDLWLVVRDEDEASFNVIHAKEAAIVLNTVLEHLPAILRSFISPACSLSAEEIAQMKYRDLYAWKKKKFPDDPWQKWEELAPAEQHRKIEEAQWYLNVIQATPASTGEAQSLLVMGDCYKCPACKMPLSGTPEGHLPDCVVRQATETNLKNDGWVSPYEVSTGEANGGLRDDLREIDLALDNVECVCVQPRDIHELGNGPCGVCEAKAIVKGMLKDYGISETNK